jgi:hypothetical protein
MSFIICEGNIDSTNLTLQNIKNVYVNPALVAEWFSITRNIEQKEVNDQLLKDNESIMLDIKKEKRKMNSTSQININHKLDLLDDNIMVLENHATNSNTVHLNSVLLNKLKEKTQNYQNKTNTIEETLLECWWGWAKRYINTNIPYNKTKDYVCLDICNGHKYLGIYMELHIKQVIKIVPPLKTVSPPYTFDDVCKTIKDMYNHFSNRMDDDDVHQYNTELFPFDIIKELNPFETKKNTNDVNNNNNNNNSKKNKKQKIKLSATQTTVDTFLSLVDDMFNDNTSQEKIDLITVPFLIQLRVASETGLLKFFKRMSYVMKSKSYLLTCLYNDVFILNNMSEQTPHILGNTSCCWELRAPKKIKKYDPIVLYWEGNKKNVSWIPFMEIVRVAKQCDLEVVEQTNLFDVRELFITKQNSNQYCINEWNSLLYFDCFIFRKT